MNGFGEIIDELKEMKGELAKLNTNLNKLDAFDKHVVELTAVTKELVKVIRENNRR